MPKGRKGTIGVFEHVRCQKCLLKNKKIWKGGSDPRFCVYYILIWLLWEIAVQQLFWVLQGDPFREKSILWKVNDACRNSPTATFVLFVYYFFYRYYCLNYIFKTQALGILMFQAQSSTSLDLHHNSLTTKVNARHPSFLIYYADDKYYKICIQKLFSW